MNYRKEEKPKRDILGSIWGFLKGLFKVVACLLSTMVVLLFLCVVFIESYRWVTDIEYRAPHQIVAIGQCKGDNNNGRCLAKIEDGRTVHTTFVMIPGQTIYERCFIRTDGEVKCEEEFEKGLWGEHTEAEAWREFNGK